MPLGENTKACVALRKRARASPKQKPKIVGRASLRPPREPGQGLRSKGSLWGTGDHGTAAPSPSASRSQSARTRARDRPVRCWAGGSPPQGSLTGRSRREKRCAANPVRVPSKCPVARDHRATPRSGYWAMGHVRSPYWRAPDYGDGLACPVLGSMGVLLFLGAYFLSSLGLER